jgi:hypothetical protein
MPHSMVQSVLFPKSVFTQKKAVGWLTKHNYDHAKVDITDNYYRFRQKEPVSGATYTVRLSNGVELIVEKDESSSESESETKPAQLIAEHKKLIKVLKKDKPSEIKAELKQQSEELKSMTSAPAPAPAKTKTSSPAQIAHRKRFGEWIKAKSGKPFAEWLAANSK